MNDVFLPTARALFEWRQENEGFPEAMKRSEEQNLEYIIRRMQADKSVDAPSGAVKYAKNLYRSRATGPAPTVIGRVLAALRVDLAPNRAAFGERSTSAGQARQMLFDSGDNAVDLRITAAANLFDIRGQILGDGFENAEVEIANDQTLINGATGETSEFNFTGLPAGAYSLTVRGGGTEIFIEQLILR